jgi:hypothetical integral membrane protein (TIGR02206 family)
LAVHHPVEPGSLVWFALNLALVISLLASIGLSKNWNESQIRRFGRGLALLLLGNLLLRQGVLAWTGEWTAHNSLPLQMCSFSVLWAAITLWTGHPLVYEFLLFWGAGALHSFLTPELDDGGSLYNHIEYTISHAGILVAGCYATLRMGLKPRPRSWLRIFAYTQVVLPVIGLVNYALDSNYMYIAQRPLVDNPFLVGPWPWYIVGLEFAALLHFVLFYHLHRWLANRSERQRALSA